MTVLGSTNFTGGAPGAAVTTTTEPLFTSKGGTIVYATMYGSVQGMQPSSAGSGNMFISSLPGTSPWLIAWQTTFTSSTSAVGIYRMVQIRSGTTLIADASLRNSTVNPGTREIVLRNSGSSVVAGQATSDPMNAGNTWSFELAYSGTTMTMRAWKNTTGGSSPDYTWTQTITSATFNMFMGPDASTGVVATMGALQVTDGSTVYSMTRVNKTSATTWNVASSSSRVNKTSATSWNVAVVGTLNMARNGYSDSSSFSTKVKVTGSSSLRMKYSTASDFSASPAFTSAIAPDSDGYQTLVATGLSSGTAYYWQIEVDGVLNTSLQGKSRTLKPSGTATNFTFGWASCFDTPNSGVTPRVFDLIAARGPEFFLMLGDEGYQYITGGPNGNTAPANTATCRTHREATIQSAGPRALFANVPFDHMYSDCDGGGANSDGTFAGFTGGNVQAAWRQQYANRTLPLSDCGARSFVVGRVRFVITDETTLASAQGATDNSSKTKLGTTQKAWWKSEMDAADAANQFVVWAGDGPVNEATSLSGNTWKAYNTERVELGNYLISKGMVGQVVRLHGDTHTLFADNGSHNSYGGYPLFSAAPMHTTAQPYASPVSSGGTYPTSTTNSARQYGICTVSDDGVTITVAMSGYASTNASPTETNPVNLTLTYTPVTRVDKTTATTSWNVRTRAAKTSATSWSVRTRLSKTAATTWNYMFRLPKTSTTTWSVRARVAKTSASSWNVLGALARVAKTSATSWSVRQRPQKTSTTSWSVRSRLGKTAVTTWSVRTRPSKTSITTWSVRQRQLKTSDTTWNVNVGASRVEKLRATTWNVRERPVKTASFNWSIRARRSKTTQTSWNVQALIIGRDRVWNGTTWVSAPVYYWSGSAWKSPQRLVYDGSEWV